jgi:predicted DNA-binding protein (UPF0251 family)
MPRRPKPRKICYEYPFILYKPAWVPGHSLEFIELKKEEIEALRLVYLEGLNMQQGAEKMWISAPTFNRIVNSWIKKLVQWIVNLKWIKLEE